MGRLPNVELMQLSPSGDLLAYIRVRENKRQLIIRNLAGQILVTADAADFKIRDLNWGRRRSSDHDLQQELELLQLQ